MQRHGELREQIEQAQQRARAGRARSGDLNQAAELKYGKLPELERQIKVAEADRGHSKASREPAHQGRGRRGGHRRGRQPLDRHPGDRSCWKARCRSCCTWRTSCTSASIGQDEAVRRWPRR